MLIFKCEKLVTRLIFDTDVVNAVMSYFAKPCRKHHAGKKQLRQRANGTHVRTLCQVVGLYCEVYLLADLLVS